MLKRLFIDHSKWQFTFFLHSSKLSFPSMYFACEIHPGIVYRFLLFPLSLSERNLQYCQYIFECRKKKVKLQWVRKLRLTVCLSVDTAITYLTGTDFFNIFLFPQIDKGLSKYCICVLSPISVTFTQFQFLLNIFILKFFEI